MIDFCIIYPICDIKTSDCILTTAKNIVFNREVTSLSYLISWLFPFVCLCVCVSVCVCVCLYPRSAFNSQPIFKFDMSTDAESPPGGVSENRFEIGVRVKKLFRKNLITQPYFNQFSTPGSYFSTDFQVWYIKTRTFSTGRCFRKQIWNKNRL